MGILYNPKLYKFFVDPFLKKVRTKVMGFVDPKGGDMILDVCCGTGDQATYYAKTRAYIVGIDLDEKMIKIARERESKYPNLKFRKADASDIPFVDNFFDYTTICLGLHEINDNLRRKIFSEMKRVTKKEGHLVIIDYNAPLPNKFASTMIRFMEYVAERENYPNFKDYLEKGGLTSLVNGSSIVDKSEAQGGILSLIKVANNGGI